MSTRLLLSVSAASTACALWRGGRLAWYETFQNSPDGWSRCGAALARVHRAPAYLVVDAVEEDYRVESMPHTSGSARQAMLQRRLGQIYRNTPYVSAIWQARLADRRRDDQFLFTAITNPELLRPWVELLQAHGLPLAGVYTTSLVHQGIRDRLRLAGASQLLVAESGGGLRQTFFQDGRLRASRLIAAAALETASVATLAGEIGKTRLYLTSLRLLGRDERLPVVLLDRDGSRAELEQALGAEPAFDCTRLDPATLTARLRVRSDSLAAGPDGLVLQLLGDAPPRFSLAPASMVRGFRLFQTRRALFATAAVTLAGGIVFSGWQWMQVMQAKQQLEELKAQTQVQQSLYAREVSQFPSTPTSAENLRRAVAIESRLAQMQRTPGRLMAVVSRALEVYPDIRLQELRWKSAPEPAATPQDAPRVQESGEIAGEVTPFDGDYKAAIARVNDFAEGLRHGEQIAEVRITELPLNVSSETGLTGSTQEARRSSTGGARFRIMLALKAP